MTPARLGPAALVLAGMLGCRTGEPDLELHRATNALAQERHDWARIHFRNDVARHPDRLSSLRGEGLAWISGYQQSLSTAGELLARYLQQVPGDHEVRRRLVRIQLLLGDEARAAATAEHLGDEPEDLVTRAETLASRDPGAAVQLVKRSLAGEEPPRALALLARLHEERGAPGEAEAAARRAVELDPLDYSTWFRLARILRRQGEPDASARALRIHELGSQLLHDGSRERLPPPRELQLVDELLTLVPDPAAFSLRRTRLLLLMRTGALDEASARARELVSHPRVTTSDLLELARIADTSGLRSLARELLARVLAVAPGNPGATSSLALLDFQAGDLAAARARLEEGLRADPAFARFHHQLALLESAEGRPDRAAARLERAVELAPWEAGWRIALADLLVAAGQPDRAADVIRAAPERMPELERYARSLAAP